VQGACAKPVIPVNKVVDPKRIVGKMEGRVGGGEAEGVTDPPPSKKMHSLIFFLFLNVFTKR
jgi:hypothetical protein